MLAGGLFADDLTWGRTWTGVWSGFGTSPYSATDTTLSRNLTIFCLDFNDEVGPPYAWQANIYGLTSANVTQNAQFGGNYGQGVPGFNLNISAAPFAFQGDTAPDPSHSVSLAASPTAYTRYLEAAWLFTNILQAQTANDINTSIISQVAAWDLFVEPWNTAQLAEDINTYNGSHGYTFNNYLFSNNNYASSPTTVGIGGLQFEDAVDEALKAAQHAVVTKGWASSAYMPTWNLVTTDPAWAEGYGRPVQEFLSPTPIPGRQNQLPPVPEPGAIMLLGTVVGIVALTQRRRWAARQPRA